MKSSGTVKSAAFFPFNRKIENVDEQTLKLLAYVLETQFERKKLKHTEVETLICEKIKACALEEFREQLEVSDNLIYAIGYLEEMQEALKEVAEVLTILNDDRKTRRIG